jgi:nucleotide-binding universal stress UspA family protein
MFAMHTIVVPTDFSELSLRALEHARDLARLSGARLVVVHVDPPLLAFAMTPHDPGAHLATLWERLHKVCPRATGLVVEHRLEEGFAADSIVRVAREVEADLIVIGTHGRTGAERAVLGSIAESVLRNATCPVLTVNQTCSGHSTRNGQPAAARPVVGASQGK